MCGPRQLFFFRWSQNVRQPWKRSFSIAELGKSNKIIRIKYTELGSSLQKHHLTEGLSEPHDGFLKKLRTRPLSSPDCLLCRARPLQNHLLDAFHSVRLLFISTLNFHYPLCPKEAKFIACKEVWPYLAPDLLICFEKHKEQGLVDCPAAGWGRADFMGWRLEAAENGWLRRRRLKRGCDWVSFKQAP